MSRVFHALTAEPWAIEPSWLPLLAALARRDHSAPEVAAAEGWQRRDYELMAGPGAQKLGGAQRAYVVDGVAVLPITGPIFPRANMMTEMSGATSITVLQNDFRAAMKDPDVGAILLLVDSPGGAVSGINSFADLVAASVREKLVEAHVAGTAASAAYWIAAATKSIAAERTGIVGSIGVVAAVPKRVDSDQDGVLDVEIVSTNAPNKRPDPTTEDGAAEIRVTLDALEQQFIADVARGRGITAAKVIEDFGKGGVKVGAAARAAGMIDRVQSYEATLGAMVRTVRNQRKLDQLRR